MSMDTMQLAEAVVKQSELIISTFEAITERLEQLESRIADTENALDDVENSDKLYKAVVELQDEVMKLSPDAMLTHRMW